SYPSRLFLHIDTALAGHGDQPRDVAFGLAQPSGVLELAGGVPEAEVEGLLFGVDQFHHQLVVFQIVHLCGLHCSAPSRLTNFVFTGSLWGPPPTGSLPRAPAGRARAARTAPRVRA